jgi:hypothetical protein
MTRRLVVLLAVALPLAGPLPAALADGDPASDYLIGQSTFLSPGETTAAEQAPLIAMLDRAQKKGLSLKVAVIVTAYDLGAVPELFDQPQKYAYFLASEDYYYWKNELIVVMPNGYGIYQSGPKYGVDLVPASDKTALRALGFHRTGEGSALIAAAEQAVRAVAARHGVALAAAAGATGKPAVSSANLERFEILGGVAVVLLAVAGFRFARRRARPR